MMARLWLRPLAINIPAHIMRISRGGCEGEESGQRHAHKYFYWLTTELRLNCHITLLSIDMSKE